jgi:hypothetical protein
MDAKISASIWSDPDLEKLPAEVLLSLHWAKTNPARNLCGAYRWSPGRFTFETKLDAVWHTRMIEALSPQFVQADDWILFVPFIRDCLQLGSGKTGAVNNVTKALAKPFGGLPPRLQESLLSAYPEFGCVWRGHQALVKPLASSSHTGSELLPFPSRSENVAATEGLTKTLVSPSTAQSSTAQHREGGTGGNEVPSEEAVLVFSSGFIDLARGIQGIDEAYALNWLAWRMSPKAGPFPTDWQGDLRRRYVADVLSRRGSEKPASSRRPDSRPEEPLSDSDKQRIEAELRDEKNPARRKQLLASLKRGAA